LEIIAAVEVDAEAVITADDEGAAFAKTIAVVAAAFGAIEDAVALIDSTLEITVALDVNAEAETVAEVIEDEGMTIVETFIKTAAGNRVAFGAKIAIDVEFPAGALRTTEAGVELEVAEVEVED
jgi:hypothetical protein